VQRAVLWSLMIVVALCVFIGCGPPSTDVMVSQPSAAQVAPDDAAADPAAASPEAASPPPAEAPASDQAPAEQPAMEQAPEESVLDRLGELPDTKEDLIERWREEAERARTDPSSTACQVVAYKLRTIAPEALLPLIDILANPKEDPFIKVCVVKSVQGQAHPILTERLLALVGPEQDATTRACATHLLGDVPSEEVLATLRTLAHDPDRRIRLAALRGLVRGGDPEGRHGLAAMWDEPGSRVQERNEIGLTLANDIQHDKENADVMMKAITDFELDVAVRSGAVAALGRALDPKAIPALEISAEKDPDESVREIAASAINLIKARGNPPKE